MKNQMSKGKTSFFNESLFLCERPLHIQQNSSEMAPPLVILVPISAGINSGGNPERRGFTHFEK